MYVALKHGPIKPNNSRACGKTGPIYPIIMKIRITILLLLITYYGHAQTLFVGYGTATLLTNQSERLVNSKDNFSLSSMQYIIGFEYKHKRLSFLGSLSAFDASTLMRINKYHREGFAGIHVRRTDIGVGYRLLKPTKKLFLKPFVMIGIQETRYFGDLWGEQVRINGPDYFINKIPTSEGYNISQVVPSAGVRFGVKIKKRVQVGLCFQGVYGFRTFQRINFYYTYKGDPNTPRRAVFESRGTGLFSSLFLGVDLWKEGYDFKKFFSQ